MKQSLLKSDILTDDLLRIKKTKPQKKKKKKQLQKICYNNQENGKTQPILKFKFFRKL